MKLFRYSYEAEIQIQASRESVWQTLVNLEDYAQWNSFTPEIKTVWEIGSKVHLTVNMFPGRQAIKQTEILRRYTGPKELAWGLNWSFLLRAERVQTLTAIDKNTTRYYTEDIISGVLSPLVHLIYGQHIQSGFNKVANDLKAFCEHDESR